MIRPKEGEYWKHRESDHRIFIVAVGIRNVLAVDNRLGEDTYYIPQLWELYEREETKKANRSG